MSLKKLNHQHKEELHDTESIRLAVATMMMLQWSLNVSGSKCEAVLLSEGVDESQ